jgi:hypothetical protein
VVAAEAIRFLVELVRTNRPIALGLTEAQWVSLALAVGAGGWLTTHVSHARREDRPGKR